MEAITGGQTEKKYTINKYTKVDFVNELDFVLFFVSAQPHGEATYSHAPYFASDSLSFTSYLNKWILLYIFIYSD